jgi:transposase InsO family protein
MGKASASLPDESVAGKDIHDDENTIAFLRYGMWNPSNMSAKELERAGRRAARYRFNNGVLFRVWPNQEQRIVPPPAFREGLIREAHDQLGHFGVLRTDALLRQTYWWQGRYSQVKRFVRQCKFCDRVQAQFNKPSLTLQPLPIMGLGYRWSLDFAGPLPKTGRKNIYVLVMVEHFSKWIELAATSSKASEVVAIEFLDRVLSRFGAPAEVLTDQGTEFKGAFQELCNKAYIDHRVTSRNHPEADGLAERIVQTVKRALRKYSLLGQYQHNWDEQLPWLAMGYRLSRQAALGTFSPYFLLFGRHPVLPGATQQLMIESVDLDDPKVWNQVITQRAELLKRAMPMAFDNLRIAQHRDTLRYAKIRGGGFRPKYHRYEVGDFVYLQQVAENTLTTKAGRVILRVRKVLPQGLLELEGRDARTVKEHVKNVAPCHLHLIDDMNPELAVVPAGYRCRQCGESKGWATMLLCDRCQAGWHMTCLRPPLDELPDGEWFCPSCVQESRRARK